VIEYGCDYFEKNYIANAYVHRGQVMSGLGFPQNEVLADFQEAIRNDPQHTYAYVLLGDQSEGETAIAYYSKAIELTPKYSVAYLKRSQAYRNQGNFQAALHDSEQANALAMTPVWKQEAARQIKELQDLLEAASPETPPSVVETPVSAPIPNPVMEDIP
jgi:tetratricopeptide (TPR) repeat protein